MLWILCLPDPKGAYPMTMHVNLSPEMEGFIKSQAFPSGKGRLR